MPIIRDENKPQHDLTEFHYGELPKEGLPVANQVGDVFVFNGTGWVFGRITGGVGINIDFNVGTNFLEISLAAFKINDDFLADAILLKTASATWTGDGIVLDTEAAAFTGDSVLV